MRSIAIPLLAIGAVAIVHHSIAISTDYNKEIDIAIDNNNEIGTSTGTSHYLRGSSQAALSIVDQQKEDTMMEIEQRGYDDYEVNEKDFVSFEPDTLAESMEHEEEDPVDNMDMEDLRVWLDISQEAYSKRKLQQTSVQAFITSFQSGTRFNDTSLAGVTGVGGRPYFLGQGVVPAGVSPGVITPGVGSFTGIGTAPGVGVGVGGALTGVGTSPGTIGGAPTSAGFVGPQAASGGLSSVGGLGSAAEGGAGGTGGIA